MPSLALYLHLCSQAALSGIPDRSIYKNPNSIHAICKLVHNYYLAYYLRTMLGFEIIKSSDDLYLERIIVNQPITRSSVDNSYIAEYYNHYNGHFDFSLEKVYRFIPDTDINALLTGTNKDKAQITSLLYQEHVPDLSIIPTEVLVAAKKKDKFKTLPRRMEHLLGTKKLRYC